MRRLKYIVITPLLGLAIYLMAAGSFSRHDAISPALLSAQEEPTLSLVAPNEAIPPDDAFDVQVVISDTVNLAAFEFNLVLNASLVSVTGMTLSDALGQVNGCDPDTQRCAVQLGPLDQPSSVALGGYSYGTGSGITGDFTLATIHLQALGQAGSTTLSRQCTLK